MKFTPTSGSRRRDRVRSKLDEPGEAQDTRVVPSNKRFRRYYHPTQAFQLDSVGIQTSSGITFANRHFSYDPSTGLLDTIRTSNGPTAVTFTAEFLDSTLTWPGNVVETIGHVRSL